MTTYRVTWEIDIEGGTPQEAAELALKIQRDPESLATYFTVTDDNKNITDVLVDLAGDTQRSAWQKSLS